MSQKISPRSAEEQLEREHSPALCQSARPSNLTPGRRNKTESGQRNGDSASSSPESSSLNGDGKRNGKSRRRKKRSANPAAAEKTEERPEKKSARPPANSSAGLTGLQHECANVWFERSAYERAESLYQCWLVHSFNGAAQSVTRAPPSHSKLSDNSPSAANAPPAEVAACHHVVEEVWLNKTTSDQAERRFAEVLAQPPVPNSLDLPSPPVTAPRTPDEGYQSLAPTPVVQQGAVTPTGRQSINGLPRIPLELLRDVWLEKPLYDRAEAAFYQNLYGNNSSKRPGCTSASRGGDHPQSLVEEEEEEEEEEKKEVEEKRVVQPGKAEIFHALHPIQEEEEPAEAVETDEVGGVCYFLHPDSERVWLDRWRYDAAESRFHGYGGQKDVVVGKKGQRPDADNLSAACSSPPLRDNTMSAVDFLAQDNIWFDKTRYDEAERRFYENMNGLSQPAQDAGANTILQDIARARENIQKSLAGLKKSLCVSDVAPPTMSLGCSTTTSTSMCSSSGGAAAAAEQVEIISRIKGLELENHSLHKVVDHLQAALSKLECRVSVLEKSPAVVAQPPAPSGPYTNGTSTVQQKMSSSAPADEEEEDDEDDDMDLFGSDDDDEEAEKLKEQRLKEYAERKAKKPGIIAKSSILLDVKPWDDETDMAKLEECVRSVSADGLLWGASKLVPVGYGIKKLQISCVVEDDKVGTDLLEEEITKFEDFIQSVDVAAFNKI